MVISLMLLKIGEKTKKVHNKRCSGLVKSSRSRSFISLATELSVSTLPEENMHIGPNYIGDNQDD